MTSGRVVAGVRSPAGGLASTTWKRMPLAWMSRCRHGPTMRVTDGSGLADSRGVTRTSPPRRVGLEWCAGGGCGGGGDPGVAPVVPGERRAGFLDRLDGLLWTADPAHLSPAQQAQYRGAQQHADEHDEERRPSPDPAVELFCEEEEKEERRVQQYHPGEDE